MLDSEFNPMTTPKKVMLESENSVREIKSVLTGS
jgi:hypothetical protein